MAAVELDGVWKRFRLGQGRTDSLRDLLPGLFAGVFRSSSTKRDFWALRDLSLAVECGETLGVIGPNGSGKSTMLKLISKILAPTRGSIRTNGRISALIEIGAGFHSDLTGRENVYLNGAILGLSRKRIRERFDEIVDFSGLAPFIDTPVKRYSSGMFARLGFSVAAHLDPEILLVDEVLAVGDFMFQRKCYSRILEFARADLAVLFVSHNFEAVRSLCPRTLLLYEGKPLYLGETDQAIRLYIETVRETSGLKTADEGAAIVVRRVWLEDANGSEALVANARGRYTAVVEVEAKREIRNPVVGFYLRAKDQLRLADGSTRMFGHELGVLHPGDVRRIRFPMTLHLLSDDYFLGAYVDRADQGETFVKHISAYAFRVAGSAETLGLLDLDMGCEVVA